jgi:hypothetical protein
LASWFCSSNGGRVLPLHHAFAELLPEEAKERPGGYRPPPGREKKGADELYRDFLLQAPSSIKVLKPTFVARPPTSPLD